MSSRAKESATAAERMRRHRTRRRNGLHYICILLHEMEIDSLVEKGFLNRDAATIEMLSRTRLMASYAMPWRLGTRREGDTQGGPDVGVTRHRHRRSKIATRLRVTGAGPTTAVEDENAVSVSQETVKTTPEA